MKKLDHSKMEQIRGGFMYVDTYLATDQKGNPHKVAIYAACNNGSQWDKMVNHGDYGHEWYVSGAMGGFSAFLFLNLLVFVDCSNKRPVTTVFAL